VLFTTKKKTKIIDETINRKHPKFIGKLIIYKFTDGFLSPSIITDEFKINPSMNLPTDDIRR